MPSKWIDHVKKFASDNNIKYNVALKDPKCKASYTKAIKGSGPSQSKVVPMAEQEEPDKYASIESMDDEPLFRTEKREIDSIPLDEYPELLKHLKRERDFHDSFKYVSYLPKTDRQRHLDEIEKIDKDIAYVQKTLSKMKGKGLRAIAKKMHGGKVPVTTVPQDDEDNEPSDAVMGPEEQHLFSIIEFRRRNHKRSVLRYFLHVLDQMNTELTRMDEEQYYVSTTDLDAIQNRILDVEDLMDTINNTSDAQFNAITQNYSDFFNSIIEKYNLQQIGGKITGGAVKDWFSPASWKDYTTSIVKGRNDYPPKMREIIQKYGDKQIVRMQACRTPVPTFLTTALNIASLGEFNKRFEKTPYDQLFHLDLRIEVMDDVKGKKRLTTVLLEKNEVLNASVNPKKPKNAECSLIQNVKKPLTIHEMLEGAKKIQGDKFFKYSANNNNCQDFIIALLKGVGAGNEENYTFIKQDTRSLFKDMPFFRKLTNTVTEIGAVANTVIEGQGISKKRLLKDVQRMEETSKYFLEILPQNNRSRGHLRNFVQDATNLKNSIKNNGTEENLRAILDYIKSMRRIVDDVHRRLYPGENPYTDKELNTDEEDDDQFNEEDFIDGFGVKTASSYVQTIIFDKSKFDKKSARKWIKEHKYADKGVDEKEDTFRFRQVNPRYIQKMGFDKFRTKKLGKNSGVSIVLAYKV